VSFLPYPILKFGSLAFVLMWVLFDMLVAVFYMGFGILGL
jgi:hypothetical protein